MYLTTALDGDYGQDVSYEFSRPYLDEIRLSSFVLGRKDGLCHELQEHSGRWHGYGMPDVLYNKNLETSLIRVRLRV